MDAAELNARMNDYLQKAKRALAEWLARLLPRTGEGWWDECVLAGLNKRQLEAVRANGIARLCQLELPALLRIADQSWYALCGCEALPAGGREVMRDMLGVRNNWAHRDAELPGKDTIISDIETLTRFFALLACDDVMPELRELKRLAGRPNAFRAEAAQTVCPAAQAQTAPEIRERSLVYLTGDPRTRGMVFSVTPLAGTTKYEVFVDGELRTFYEGQIAPVDMAPKREWVSADTLRCHLTAWQINNPSAGKLYSLNSARIDFVPYQFRPALKLIKADEPRILIADSVGVGKTIEAGLIIKELEARSGLENIMVVCPKPLVVDRKWESEMKRFDEEFIPLNGDELRQAISDTDRDGEWPARFSRVIVPYSILDERTYQGTTARRGRRIGLVDLDPAPRFDLVIIDEAHHLRNGSMDKEKAFAYKCAHFFCGHAAAVVMLTATPLQTSDDDLYTLLNLLRPDVVIDKPSFAMMARPNPYISACAHSVRLARPGWQTEALEALDKVLTTQWGEDVIARNPTFERIRGKLRQENISRNERVELITDIESLHSFNMMLNRTRRKDIHMISGLHFCCEVA